MDQLIDTIRAAVATDASKEQKAAGVHACRTIVAALDTEPGKPIVLHGAPPKPPLSGVSFDQVLDLLIGKLTAIAHANDANQAAAELLPPRDAVARPAPPRTGLRVPAARPANVARAANVARPASVARPANVAHPANVTRPANTARPNVARRSHASSPAGASDTNTPPRKP
jgi:hypothetical protein